VKYLKEFEEKIQVEKKKRINYRETIKKMKKNFEENPLL